MRAYHRLTEGQRNQVYALKKAGLKQYAIADQIGVSKSTISRNLSATQVCADIAPSRRIVWLVHGRHKFAGPVSRMRRGLGLKK
jgi:predicted transcriptional regulator